MTPPGASYAELSGYLTKASRNARWTTEVATLQKRKRPEPGAVDAGDGAGRRKPPSPLEAGTSRTDAA